MTAEALRGRRITIAIGLLAAGPPVLLLLLRTIVSGNVPISDWVMNGAVNVVLAWLLVKGRSWVRWLTIVGFGLGGVFSILRAALVTGPMLVRAVVLVLGAVQFCAAVVLARSSAVDAYFRAENDAATLNLSA